MSDTEATATGNTEVVEGDNVSTETTSTNAGTSGATTENNTEATETSQGANDTEPALGFDINAVKLPEGMSASDEDKQKVAEAVKKFGINSQEGLQSFVDWLVETAAEGNKQQAEASEAEAKKAAKEWEDIKSSWKTSLKSDADFGKNYDENIERANKAMTQFGGSEFTTWLKDADLIEHPALLKTFARIGKDIEDAKILTGQKSVSSGIKRDRYNQPMITYNE